MKILLLALVAVTAESSLQPGVEVELTSDEASELMEFRQTHFTLSPGEVEHLSRYRKSELEEKAKREAQERQRNSTSFVEAGKELITSPWFLAVAAFFFLFAMPGPWLWRRFADWRFERWYSERARLDRYREALEEIVEADQKDVSSGLREKARIALYGVETTES